MDKTTQELQAESAPINGRRRFFNKFWALLGSLACLELGWISFSILRSGKEKMNVGSEDVIIKAGIIEDFAINSVTAIPQGQFYLSCLEDGSFLALSRTCTHLGCSVPWDVGAHKFICPCHGSSFAITGEVLTAPATRSLNTHPLRIENGVIYVNTGKIEKTMQDGKSRSVKA
jgi:cytochrome b6-f complex iron-sulfur subunit